MATISLCVIAKNEENYIDNCLNSVYDIVDEIIIVDTGSNDNTKEICKKYTNKIYDYPFNNDFSEVRNYCIEKATKDFILVFDADDIILEEEKKKLLFYKNNVLDCLDKDKTIIYLYYDIWNKNEKNIQSQKLFRNKRGVKYFNFICEELVNEQDKNKDCFGLLDVMITHTRSKKDTLDHGNNYIDIIIDRYNKGIKFTDKEKYLCSKIMIDNYIQNNRKGIYLLEISKIFLNELLDNYNPNELNFYLDQHHYDAAEYNLKLTEALLMESKRNTISLCMIVKNEENYIDNCLNSVHDLVDEIVIVDTGSTDKTKEICKKYTDRIYDFKWVNDFAKARNFSFSKARCDYIFWLDADDILKEEDRNKFKLLKENLNENYNAISMIYDYAFDQNGNPTLTLRRNRIVKRIPKHEYWVGFVHEVINVAIDNSFDSDIHVSHTRVHSNGTRNLDLFEDNLKKGVKFDARNTLYYAKELYYNGRLNRAIEWFNKFFKFKEVWIEDKIDAYIKVSDIYRQLGDVQKEREYLLRTMELAPRAEALYPLGLTYSRENKWEQAIVFFEGILLLEYPTNNSGFFHNDMWNVKPLIELSCCYYYLGKMDKAKECHLKAKSLDPNNEIILSNDKFFQY